MTVVADSVKEYFMSEEFSIKETKEILLACFKIAGSVKAANADGKIDINDAALFFSVIPTLGPAFEGISNVPKELKDLSAEEVSELEIYISKEVGDLVEKEKLMSQINAGLKLVHSMYDFFITLK
jgi:hypothetical protein